MAEYNAPNKEGIKKTIDEPSESKTPLSLRDFFLLLRKVVRAPAKKPISKAGNGLGNTLELDP